MLMAQQRSSISRGTGSGDAADGARRALFSAAQMARRA